MAGDTGPPGTEVADATVPTHDYRPHLDGVRAVAVYLVVLFHAGVPRFGGGFIGVDVFFVLSGYLVTQLLLRDLDGQGSIRYGRFYSRRIRRLLPAATVTLLVTAAVYSAVAGPLQVDAAADAIRACFLYVANWHFINEATDYFSEDVTQSPVIHLWSLAVEEQFYLVWPLLLGGLWWVTRGRQIGHRRVLPLVVACGAVASLGWALALRGDQPSRAYFGTEARAYQLLLGALLALLPGLVARVRRSPVGRALAPLGLGGILLLATSAIDVGPVVRGAGVAAAAGLLLIGLEGTATSRMGRVLSVEPLVYLGRISYATYLWHWLVIVVAGELGLTPSPLALAGITFLIATGLAALSYELLEHPIRESRSLGRHRRVVIGVGLATSVACALLIVPELTEPDTVSAVVAEAPTTGFTPVPESFVALAVHDEGFGETVDCVDDVPEACTVVEGDGKHILLIGDSNALMMVPAFTALAEEEGLRLSLAVEAGCPWQRDLYRFAEDIRARCERKKPDAYDRVIPALDPDLIVAVNVHFPETAEEFSGSKGAVHLRDTTEASIAELSAGGRDVVIIKSMPTPAEEQRPLACLAKADVVERCRFVAPERKSWLDDVQQDLAERSDSVTFVDWDRMVCPFLPICDAMIGGVPVFWNTEHITERYSRTLGPPIAEQLRELGLL